MLLYLYFICLLLTLGAGISQSVELEPPLSPSLLPDDPVNSEWENDKAQFPGEPFYNYIFK